MQQFYSRFGGLWVDQTDREAVGRRIEAIVDPTLRQSVADFDRCGFAILGSAVSHAAIDEYMAQYTSAAEAPDAAAVMLMSIPFGPMSQPFDRAKTLTPGAKVLDTAMLLPAGAALSFAPAISQFLETIFEEPPLAFQSLHFEVGSTQAIHQDTAYVVVDREPIRLAASWIALEDIKPGSGELAYYIGGHRMKEYTYADGTSKNFNRGRDGNQPHHDHLRFLHDEAALLGLERGSFLPKKGDALIWHSDLPHGGGPITDTGITRRSLVTHYCPASMRPHYFKGLPAQRRHKVGLPGGNAFCSMYFSPGTLPAGDVDKRKKSPRKAMTQEATVASDVAKVELSDPHPIHLAPAVFVKTIVRNIPGWLHDVTALRTIDFLSWQEQSGIVGPLLEIGVFGGRYFSILARSAGRLGSHLVGVDTFQWVEEIKVRQNIGPVRVDSSLIKLERTCSSDLDADDLIELCGGKPRFISVDGSHEFNDVSHDLALVESVLATKGIAALNDFLNPLTLGVNQAINAFFSTPRNLRPFAYIRNKLFVCRPSCHKTLLALVPRVTLADEEDLASRAYRENRSAKPESSETMAWGHRMALLP